VGGSLPTYILNTQRRLVILTHTSNKFQVVSKATKLLSELVKNFLFINQLFLLQRQESELSGISSYSCHSIHRGNSVADSTKFMSYQGYGMGN
jgi:hypothetical protein